MRVSLDGRVLDTSGASTRKSSQASSRALRPPFWSSGLPQTSRDLQGRSSTASGTSLTRPSHRKQANLTRKCLKQKVVPGLFQSSQATVLELWASPDLLRLLWTQFDEYWSHLETPQKHRKRPDLTGKCLNQEVVIQASSRALRPLFWSSELPLTSCELLGPSSRRPPPSGSSELPPNLPNYISQIGCDAQFWQKSDPPGRTRNLKTLLPDGRPGRKQPNLTEKCLK